MNLLASEIAPEHRCAHTGQRGGEVGGVCAYPGEGAHAGVDDFLAEEIGAVR